jgi:hypothetical protein
VRDPRWLLLVHSLPPKPLYLRAKIRQRLVKVGALALKNSVYLLPRTEDCLEDFEWIAEEARAGGGEAFVAGAEFLEGIDARELVERFRRERTAEYEALALELRRLALFRRKGSGNATKAEREAVLARARRRLEEIRAVDFFDAPGRKEAETMLRKMEEREHSKSGGSPPRRGPSGDLVGKIWVTRRGVKIDRIASAWLVHRFIDPAARFRFVDPSEDVKRPGELRFDMVGGDFTHEHDRCTFETLRLRAGLDDLALEPIAHIVHDIDLKDGKYGRPDAAGVKQLVEGLLAAHAGDEERLERGFALFDDLYASFRGQKSAPSRLRRKRRRK